MRFGAPVAVVMAGACDSLDRADGPLMPADSPLSAEQSQPPQDWDPDLEFARLARGDVAGFAGLYLEADGTPVILLKDPAQSARAERHFASQLAGLRKGRNAGAPRRPVFRAAAYDFAELREWFDGLEGMSERGDVFMLDIDEMNNRVWVGVRDAAGIQAVREEAVRLGIPRRALHVAVQPPPARRSSLQTWTPSMMGGYQIMFGPAVENTCTAGFNANYNGQWIFVTNAHCTASMFEYDGGSIAQPSWASNNFVGQEVRDRFVYKCTSVSFIACRRSDAAYIAHNFSRPMDQGRIAYTQASRGSHGGIDVLGAYDVMQRQTSVYVGLYLDKSGRTSGSTYGQVLQTCVKIDYLRCQDISDVFSTEGDSGSPMYARTSPGVALYGILWGGPAGDPTRTYSSRLEGIEQDLGALTGLCRPEYGC